MPENVAMKIPQSPAPVVRTGAGDISERELSRERYTMQTTPTTRVQPAHRKRQLFSAPVSKFTAKVCPPNPNLARIKSCLNKYSQHTTPARPTKIRPKAVSMEDLTPIKKLKNNRNEKYPSIVGSPVSMTSAQELAAAKVARFMVVSAWRRRREDVRCLRKTLEYQVSSSERLRLQVSTLKALLDADNSKLRLAIRELDRLKQLLRDKDQEKGILEKEKMALERDVCAAEDRASELSIGWRNCRNELAGVEAALTAERAAGGQARAQRDHAYTRLSQIEDELQQHEALLSDAEQRATELRAEADARAQLLQETSDRLRLEQEAHARCERESEAVRAQVRELRGELHDLRQHLQRRRDWLPSIAKCVCVARGWLWVPAAAIGALLPAARLG